METRVLCLPLMVPSPSPSAPPRCTVAAAATYRAAALLQCPAEQVQCGQRGSCATSTSIPHEDQQDPFHPFHTMTMLLRLESVRMGAHGTERMCDRGDLAREHFYLQPSKEV